MNKTLPVPNKHRCPNCSNWITNKFGFCTTEMFGKVLPSVCEEQYNQYWRDVAQKKQAISLATV